MRDIADLNTNHKPSNRPSSVRGCDGEIGVTMSTETSVAKSPDPASSRLPYPPGVSLRRFDPAYTAAFIVYHSIALLAFVPWLFTWIGLASAIFGLYFFGTLGINLCYHRLLTHRSFACPRWLERCLSIIGVLCLQDTPARWVGVHRMHHQHSDDPADPHSPLAGFFWGHMGWLMHPNPELSRMQLYERYSKDLIRDRFYFNLERGLKWVWINLVSWVAFFVAGYAGGYLVSGPDEALRVGLSLLVWGVFVRTVLVWHITWSVNSLAHIWGYRNYNTNENSRNNVFVGIISNGEGWHNNHHAQPRCAAHGHRWFEFDVTWITIWLLRAVGLAWDVVPIRKATGNAPAIITDDDLNIT
jgi:stearoyl-CoA desaturase (delta-9 desaturase)